MTPSSPNDLAALAGRLVAAIGGDPGTTVAALLEMLNCVEGMVAVKDAGTGRYVYASERLATLFGRTPEALIGTGDAEWLEPAQAALLRTADQLAVTGGSTSTVEHRIDIGGQRREFNVTRVPFARAGAASPTHLGVLWVDLTSQRQREAQSKKLLAQLEEQQAANESLRREREGPTSREDTLGLYERSHFDDQLRREADLSTREHRQFSLVSIVLDPLSELVLELGAEGRAKVLEALGRLLRGNTRAMDASCRVDEGRFAVLLSGVGLATAHSRMEGLRRQCATQIVALHGKEVGFTVSMGVASFPHTAATQEALVEAVNAALAEAIRRGGNQVALAGIRFDQV